MAAADNKVLQNNFVDYEVNKDKTNAINRKEISLPLSARQQLYNLASWNVGLDEDDVHVSLSDISVPEDKPKHTVNLSNKPLKNIKETFIFLRPMTRRTPHRSISHHKSAKPSNKRSSS